MGWHETAGRRQGRAGVVAASVMALLGASGIAGAEEPAPPPATAERVPLAAALEGLQPGQTVRLGVADGTVAEGRVAAIRNGRLLLEGWKAKELRQRFPDGVPLERVDWARVRGRGTKTGKGAVVGGAIGLLAYVGYFLPRACPECWDYLYKWPGHVKFDIAVAVAAGAFAGGVIGSSAAPEWRPLRRPGHGAPGVPRRGPLGSASLLLGHGHADDDFAPGGGRGWGLRLDREGTLGSPFFKLRPGLELGRTVLGLRTVRAATGKARDYRESLTYAGPTLAAGPTLGAVHPYAIAGLGCYGWKVIRDVTPDQTASDFYSPEPTKIHGFVGASLGGGLRLDTGDTLSLSGEARWHRNVTAGPQPSRDRPERRLNVFSANAGLTLRW